MRRTKVLVLGIDGIWPELIEKYIESEVIPNISRIVKRGSFVNMLPLPPCDTPTNWISLVTGATPGRHGALGFNIHLPGEPLDHARVPDTKHVTAEFIWDVAEKTGRLCILLNWPFSWPPTIKKGVVVAGTGPGDPRWRIEYGCIYTTDPVSAREVKIELREAKEWKNLPQTDLPPLESELPLRITKSAFVWTESGWEQAAAEIEEATPMSMRLKRGEELRATGSAEESYHVLVFGRKGEGYDTVIIAKEKDASNAIAMLSVDGERWSDWIYDEYRFKVVAKYHGARVDEPLLGKGPLKGVFKIKLVDLSKDGKHLTLFRTDIFRVGGWIHPENLLSEILENVGPYCEGLELIPLITITRDDWNTYFELLEEQARWFIKAYKYLCEKYDWDLFFLQLHIFDALNHFLLRYLHKKSPDYSEEKARKVWKIYEKTLAIVDRFVGELLESGPKDLVFAIVSDHGALPTWKLVWPGTALMKKGLLSLKEREDGKVEIDWENTKAFPWVMDVWVNLKGRFPHGVVTENEYEKIVEKVVDALYSMRDPETGERVMALVITKKEGVFFGLSGENVADVYYFFRPPYTDIDVHRHKILELSLDDIKKLERGRYSKTIAAHDHYLPNEKMGVFSNMAVLLMYGPGIKEGCRLQKPVFTTDLVPTLCHMLEIPFPAQCEGRILFDILTNPGGRE